MDFYLTTSASTFPRIKITWMIQGENMNINLFLAGNFPPGFRDDFVYFA
jgi:hypothetical protein